MPEEKLNYLLVREFLGNNSPVIEYHELLDSTNQRAKELARAGAAHGTVVIAEQQTAGRGRLGRSFDSPGGCGLYMTVILRPEQGMDSVTGWTPFAAVVAAESVESLIEEPVQIKWVNDLYLRGKKICGILAEGGLAANSDKLDYLLIGVGINVRSRTFDPELSKKAGSIEDLTGKVISRERLAAMIVHGLISEESTDLAAFMDDYRKRSLVLKKTVSFPLSGKTVQGCVEAIEDDAALRIRLDDGELVRLSAGEVSLSDWS